MTLYYFLTVSKSIECIILDNMPLIDDYTPLMHRLYYTFCRDTEETCRNLY